MSKCGGREVAALITLSFHKVSSGSLTVGEALCNWAVDIFGVGEISELRDDEGVFVSNRSIRADVMLASTSQYHTVVSTNNDRRI